MKYIINAFTDIGIKKESNQDSIAVKAAQTHCGDVIMGIVCDGLGGLSKGELASSLAVHMYCSWFENKLPEILGERNFEEQLMSQWTEIAFDINKRLFDYGKANSLKLGTTLTCMLIFKGKYYVINVGDSRLYELTKGIRQVTADHSYVAREVLMGRMTPEQAKTDRNKNVLLQCIGAAERFTPDFYSEKLKHNAVYILCSDGFRNKISDEEIYENLKPSAIKSKEQINQMCLNLIETDKQRLETDNISVGVIKIC